MPQHDFSFLSYFFPHLFSPAEQSFLTLQGLQAALQELRDKGAIPQSAVPNDRFPIEIVVDESLPDGSAYLVNPHTFRPRMHRAHINMSGELHS